MTSLRGFFRVLSCSFSYCCLSWILSSIVITLLGERQPLSLYFLVCDLCTVCLGLIALSPGVVVSLVVIGRLCSMVSFWTTSVLLSKSFYQSGYSISYQTACCPANTQISLRIRIGWSEVSLTAWKRQPRWLSWMRCPIGDQEVAGSTPAEVGNILSSRLIMTYFLRSFSPFHWFKKGSCQFLAKECAQYWLTA